MDSLTSVLFSDPSRAERRPVRVDTVTVHELDGEALIFDPGTGDTHRLNETALFIWRCCDGSRDLPALAAALADAYEVAVPEAREHVERMVRDFDERGLLADDG